MKKFMEIYPKEKVVLKINMNYLYECNYCRFKKPKKKEMLVEANEFQRQ